MRRYLISENVDNSGRPLDVNGNKCGIGKASHMVKNYNVEQVWTLSQ